MTVRGAIALVLSLLVLPASLAALPLPPSPVPISGNAVRRAIAAGLEANDREAVTRSTLLLRQMGGSLSTQSWARIAPLLDRAHVGEGLWRGNGTFADILRASFDFAAQPLGNSRPVAAVPERYRLIEGIAYDPVRGTLFAGSVIDRSLLRQRGAAWERLPVDGLGGVFGMFVDAPRRLLWLASSDAEVLPAGEPAFNGIVAVDLRRLREVRRIAIPDGRPGDVTVAADGTVYASDVRSGAIYACPPGCTAMRVLVPPGRLPNPQGLAIRFGELIVADYVEGLVRIDPATGATARLLPNAPNMMEGIDGLIAYGPDELIAIQNGTRPVRILRLRLGLDMEGRIDDVASFSVIEQGEAGWGEPTLGTIRRGHHVYVADGQWERYGPGGTRRDTAPPRATAIRSMSLDY